MALNNSPKFNGEPSIQALASGLGTLGRYGDSYMVHAAEGETFVPKEIFEANPQLKNDLMRQMVMMGIKDPDRFVVGNAMNSINPITGQPEFFFKSIFKAIKKVVKKIAPVVVPMVANYIAPGIGGILASGLMTKVQGGSWTDALKSAGMAYAGQGIMSGISGAMRPGAAGGWSGFTEGLQKGFTAPFSAASNLFSDTAANPFNQGAFGSAGAGNLPGASFQDKYLPQYDPNASFAAKATSITSPMGGKNLVSGSGSGSNAMLEPSLAQEQNFADLTISQGDFGDELVSQPFTDEGAATLAQYGSGPGSLEAKGLIPKYKYVQTTAGETVKIPFDPQIDDLGYPDPNFMSTSEVQPATGDFKQLTNVTDFAPGDRQKFFGKTYEATQVPGGPSASGQTVTGPTMKWAEVKPKGMFDFGITDATAKGIEGLGVGSKTAATIAEYGVPMAGLAAAGWALSPEEEAAVPSEGSRRFSAYDAWTKLTPDQKNSADGQAKYWAWRGGSPYVTRADFEARIGGTSNRPDWFFLPPEGGISTVGAAGGGEVMGPGTGRSDSIPARLSDGEFVMTAKAVENAGGGNRALGAARMYEMMNRFERSAA